MFHTEEKFRIGRMWKIKRGINIAPRPTIDLKYCMPDAQQIKCVGGIPRKYLKKTPRSGVLVLIVMR